MPLLPRESSVETADEQNENDLGEGFESQRPQIVKGQMSMNGSEFLAVE